MGNRTGGNTSSVSYSAARLQRIAKARQRQEARWERMAGAVTVRQLSAEELAQRKGESDSERRRRIFGS